MKKHSVAAIILMVFLTLFSCALPDEEKCMVIIKDSVNGNSEFLVNRNSVFSIPDLEDPDNIFLGAENEEGQLHAPGSSVVIDKNTTFIYRWEKKVVSYTIKCIIDSEDIRIKEVKLGNTFKVPSVPVRDGYTLKITDETGKEYAEGTSFEVTSDMTLKWNWTPIPAVENFTVKCIIDANDIRTSKVERGKSFTVPSVPARTGYTLKITDSTGKEYSAGSFLTVTSDVTLTWNWTAIPEIEKFTVKCIVDTNDVRTSKVEKGKTFTVPSVSAKDGYTLKITDGEGKEYTAGDSFEVTSNVTLTWNWTVVPAVENFTVKCIIDADDIKTSKVERGKSFTVPSVPARTGYTLKITDSTGKEYSAGSLLTVTSDVTLTWIWTAVPSAENYTITCISDGKVFHTEVVEKGTSFNVPKVDNRYGYEYTITSDDGKEYYTDWTYQITGNLTLTWNWKLKQYTVTCKIDDTTTEKYTVEHENDFIVPSVTEREGFIYTVKDQFHHEYKPGESISVNKDISLTWNWIPVADVTYKVTCMISPSDKRTENVTHGSVFRIPDIKKEGQYAEISDDSGNTLEPGAEVSIKKDTVFTWKWKQMYKVTFRNGGTVLLDKYVKPGDIFRVPELEAPHGTVYTITDQYSAICTPGKKYTVYSDLVFNVSEKHVYYVTCVYGENNSEVFTVDAGNGFTIPEKQNEPGKVWRVEAAGEWHEGGDYIYLSSDITLKWNSFECSPGDVEVRIIYEPGVEKIIFTPVDSVIRMEPYERKGYIITGYKYNNVPSKSDTYQISGKSCIHYCWTPGWTVKLTGPGAPSSSVYKIVDGGEWTVPSLDEYRPGQVLQITDARGRSYRQGETLKVTEDIILTWEWHAAGKDDFRVTVSGEGIESREYYLTSGSPFKIPALNKVGYTLKSITDDDGRVYRPGEVINVGKNINLVYVYTPTSVKPDHITIRLIADGKVYKTEDRSPDKDYMIPEIYPERTLISITDDKGGTYKPGEIVRLTRSTDFTYKFRESIPVTLVSGKSTSIRWVEKNSDFIIPSLPATDDSEFISMVTVDDSQKCQPGDVIHNVTIPMKLTYYWDTYLQIRLKSGDKTITHRVKNSEDPYELPVLERPGYVLYDIVREGAFNEPDVNGYKPGDVIYHNGDKYSAEVFEYIWKPLCLVKVHGEGIKPLEYEVGESFEFILPQLEVENHRLDEILINGESRGWYPGDSVIVTGPMDIEYTWVRQYCVTVRNENRNPAEETHFIDAGDTFLIYRDSMKDYHLDVIDQKGRKYEQGMKYYVEEDLDITYSWTRIWHVSCIAHYKYRNSEEYLPEPPYNFFSKDVLDGEEFIIPDASDKDHNKFVSARIHGKTPCEQGQKVIIDSDTVIDYDYEYAQHVTIMRYENDFKHTDELVKVVPGNIFTVPLEPKEGTIQRAEIKNKKIDPGTEFTVTEDVTILLRWPRRLRITLIDEFNTYEGGGFDIGEGEKFNIECRNPNYNHLRYINEADGTEIPRKDWIVASSDMTIRLIWTPFSMNDQNLKLKNPSHKYEGDIVIPKKLGYPVNAICNDCFKDQNKIVSVSIPDSVTVIENGAFSGCTALRSVVMSSDIKDIRENAFRDCSSLTSIELPEGLLEIGSNAFRGCSSLTSFHLPSTCSIFNANSISYCPSLKSLSVASGNTDYYSSNNCIVNRKSKEIVKGCSTSAIPIGLTHIGAEAFSGCSGITHLNLSNVVSIGDLAFSDCTGINSLTIPNTVEYIGHQVFNGWSNRQTITKEYNSKCSLGPLNIGSGNPKVIYLDPPESN